MIISHIVVADEKNGIGKNQQLLCHLPADLKYFKNVTTGHHVVMGRKTYEAVGRPLPNRTNVVITRSVTEIPGCIVAASLEEALDYARSHNETEVFITGGGVIFDLSLPITNRIYLTRIHHSFESDTWYPSFDQSAWKEVKNEFHRADEKNPYDYSFLVYERK